MPRDPDSSPFLVTPADGWVFFAVIGGSILAIAGLSAERLGAERTPFSVVLSAFGVLQLVTGFFFCMAVPGPGSINDESLSRFALRLLHRLPRPRPAVRAAALCACLAPFLLPVLAATDVPFSPAAMLAAGLVAVLMIGGVLMTQSTRNESTPWDALAPLCVFGLSLAYAAGSRNPRMLTVGLSLVWVTQLLFLRLAATRHWAAMAVIAQSERGAPANIVSLAAYAAELEAAAPVAKPPAPAAGGVIHVGSGTFRVDASKMLEKLRERQLADAADFILAWLRCVVASGAPSLAVTGDWRALRLRFFGRPFSEAELRDPYRALLDSEAEEATRGAQLAYGLLAVLRFDPASVWVLSGPPEQRVRFSLSSRGGGELEAPPDHGNGTLLQVTFSGLAAPWRVWQAAYRARRGFGLCGMKLVVAGRESSDPFGAPDWRCDEQSGWKIAWRPRSGEAASRVRVYHLGALAEEFEQPIGAGPQKDVALTHPELRLSLSQSSVVRDPTFKRGLKLLERLT